MLKRALAYVALLLAVSSAGAEIPPLEEWRQVRHETSKGGGVVDTLLAEHRTWDVM